MILDGDLPLHERLSEPVLSERLGVSRTPVRAALAKLEHEGLVELLPGSGYRIRVFGEREIFDAIELRGTLEGLAARFAAELRPNRAQVEALRESITEIDRLIRLPTLSEDDFALYMKGNGRFHERIVSLAGSEVLARSLTHTASLPFASPNAFVMAQSQLPESREILFIAQYQHHCLIEAIESGDGARAESVAREHARIAKRNLEVVLDNREASAQIPGLRLVKRTAT